MFKKLTISNKLVFIFISISILIILSLSSTVYFTGRSDIEAIEFERLLSIREIKATAIERYINQTLDELNVFAKSKMTINAMKEFSEAYFEIKPDNKQLNTYQEKIQSYYINQFKPQLEQNKGQVDIDLYIPSNPKTQYLQYHYIMNNPNTIGEKNKLIMADDGSLYSKVHQSYHAIFNNYITKLKYYDMFLIDIKTGNIVYSVFKETDYATSLMNGEYNFSNLGRIFSQVTKSRQLETEIIIDFEPYDPSYAKPAMFIATPIIENNKKIGVLALQVSIDEINSVMTNNGQWEKDGLGESGETYLIGNDLFMRSESRFHIENPEGFYTNMEKINYDSKLLEKMKSQKSTILTQRVETNATLDVIKGNISTQIVLDYRGLPVLSSYRPLKLEGLNWYILSEIDEEEALKNINALLLQIIIIAFVILIIVGIIILFVSRSFTKPILLLNENAQEIASGNLDILVNKENDDEIGELTESFQKMVENVKVARNEIQKQYNQSSSIIKNVKEGLFLLSKDFKISQEHSEELKAIFRKDRFDDVDFIQLLRPIITERDLEALKYYIKHLYNDDIDDDTLSELNPVANVDVHFEVEPGQYETKSLAFRFVRILNNNQIVNVLVTILDETEMRQLIQQLEETEANKHSEMEQFLSILKVEPIALKDYLESCKHILQDITERFEKEKISNYHEMAGQVFKTIHSIKGNASLLELDIFVKKSHEIEETLTNLLAQQKLVGSDFLKFLFQIEEMLNYINSMFELMEKFTEVSKQIKTDQQTKDNEPKTMEFCKNLEGLSQKLGKEMNKSVKLLCNIEPLALFPTAQFKIIKDIAIQLVKNSLVHGIEKEDIRVNLNKDRTGVLNLELIEIDDSYSLKYRDDGQGLDIEKLKSKAVESGLINGNKDTISDNDVAKLIFKDNLSTSDIIDEHAGRGHGMGLVYKLSKDLNGKISFKFARNKYFELSIQFPKLTVKEGI